MLVRSYFGLESCDDSSVFVHEAFDFEATVIFEHLTGHFLFLSDKMLNFPLFEC